MRLTYVLLLLTATSLATAAAGELAVHVGQVLIKNADCLIVKGDRWAGWVRFKETPACREGDVVRITGKAIRYKWTSMEILMLRDLNVLESRPLPAARDVSGHEIFDGRTLFEFVRFKGVLASVSPGEHGWSWAIVRTATGDVGVTVRESYHTCEELRRLLDAEVAIRGIVVYSWGSEQKLGAHVSMRGDKALEILSPPPDPLHAPAFTSTVVAHRQKLTGTVLARGENRLAVQSAAHGIVQVVPTSDADLPDATDMNAFVREIVRPHVGSARLAVRFNVARRTLSDNEAYAIGRIIREAALHDILDGRQVLSPDIRDLMLASDSADTLTPRQHEILGYLAKGLSNRDIASLLDISEDGVKFHLRSLFSKLGAATRTEAVAIALGKRLLKV